jgi:hypothetical protein
MLLPRGLGENLLIVSDGIAMLPFFFMLDESPILLYLCFGIFWSGVVISMSELCRMVDE